MILPPSEKQKLLVTWNTMSDLLPKDSCVHLLFEAQVAKSSNATAVVFEDVILSYAALNARANQLAHALIALGVKADEPVGVALERSPEAIISLLAIFKAGGVYVPFDPDYPAARLTFMLEDSCARILITRETLRDRLPLKAEHTIYLDRDEESLATHSESNPDLPIVPDSLAYIIYTSGSTGRPKGVAVEHRSIAQHCQTIQTCFELTSQDRVLQFASLSFDASLAQILPPLSSGAAIVLPLPGLNSPEILDACLRRQKVTVMHLTPAFFSLWSLSCQSNLPPSLRVINSGGDVLPPGSLKVRESWSRPGLRLVNTYGPTEATITATMYDIPEGLTGSYVPIGRPLPHRTVYVLDKEMQPTPIGVAGELHIGGACLARGYLNRPELTAEKFIPDPFSSMPGARLYKTGDLVRYRPDGNLEFLGRLDHQVKIRGFRIELGEIEAVLRSHSAISETVVIRREDEPGSEKLVAYVVAKKEVKVKQEDLRTFMRKALPAYMIPSAFVFLEKIPMTPNRKIDRNALPPPDRIIEKTITYVAPRDAIEKQLVELWEKVLGVHPIGIYDNFFDIGGHSLLSLSLLLQIHHKINSKITLSDFYQALTIDELAQMLRKDELSKNNFCMVCLQKGTSKKPLPPLYFIHVLGTGLKFCKPMVKYLGSDLPVYGLSIQLLDQHPHIENRIEDWARFYILQVKQIQPSGPYMFIGFSNGGIIAFEMAKQMRESGEDVRLVAILDAILPKTFKKIGVVRKVKEQYKKWKRQGAYYFVRQVVQRLYYVWREKITHWYFRKILWYYKVTGGSGEMTIDLKEYVTWSENHEASIRYNPEPYAGKVMLFKSDHTLQEVDNIQDPQLGWGEVSLGGVEIINCPGNHLSMLADPLVKTVAKKLRQSIDRALNPEIQN